MDMKLIKRSRDFIFYIFTAVVSAVIALPFIWMLLSSVKSQEEVLSWPPVLLPAILRPENFIEAYHYINIPLLFRNTMILVAGSILLQVMSSVFVAYGFARFKAPGSKTLFYILLSTMMLPWVVTMIPAYVIFMKIGWLGSFLPLIIPQIGGSAFNIFMTRQFLMGLPRELDEAATIDGCNEAGILFRIIMPLCKPILATVIVFSFIGTWSDFIGPSIYLNDPEMYTLSLGLQTFRGLNSAMPWHLVMAACVIFALPMILVFFFAQNAFTKGIVMTGLKE